jgi:hypothetical protein
MVIPGLYMNEKNEDVISESLQSLLNFLCIEDRKLRALICIY